MFLRRPLASLARVLVYKLRFFSVGTFGGLGLASHTKSWQYATDRQTRKFCKGPQVLPIFLDSIDSLS